MRGAGRKDPLLLAGAGRQNFGSPATFFFDVLVKHEENPRILPAVQTENRVLVAASWIQLDLRLDAPRNRSLARRRDAFAEGRVNDADGVE